MVELFAPLRGLNLDFERDTDTGRDINLWRDIWLTPISPPNSLAKSWSFDSTTV